MGIAYRADGRLTHLSNSTHYARNTADGDAYRKWLDTLEDWPAPVEEPPSQPEPYPFDTSVGKTGYDWITSRGD